MSKRDLLVDDGYAYISVSPDCSIVDTTNMEQTLEASDGVLWAAYNGVLGRMVVRYDPVRTSPPELAAIVGRLGGDGATKPPGASTASLAALGADLMSVGAGLAGRVLRLPRLPVESAALPSIVEMLPRLSRRVESMLGRTWADVGMAVTSAAIGAASQSVLPSVTDAALRALLLAETSAHERAFKREAPVLCRDAQASRAARLPPTARPAPLPDGPIERYARRISTVTLLAAGALLPVNGGRRRAARAVAVGSPRAARLGREAYASQLGRVLARRGVLVREPQALRRLDRVDTVVIDAPVLTTGPGAELDPLGAALVAAARKVGRVIVAGATPELLRRVQVDDRVAGGSRLAESVRALQRENHGVTLVAARNDVALAAADCGIGIARADSQRPPWGAHVLCGPDLEAAWLVLESATLAREVSGRSARIALLGSVAGALLGLLDPRPAAGQRALTAAGVGSMAGVASGLWAALEIERRPTPVPEDLMPWHALPVNEVLRLLDASGTGLADEQARQRRDALAEHANGERGMLAATVAELNTPFTAPLAVGAGVAAAAGSTTDAVLVVTVMLANALLSAVQERRARSVLRGLLTAGALRVRLRRTDSSRLATADELVPGDVLSLEPGDAVPADCRLITEAGLEMDESNLTGESVPVAKSATPTLATAIADRTSMVYAGTTVAAGTATAVVVAVGRSTEAGRSAHMVIEEAPTGGVQARLRRIAEATIPASAVAAAGLFLGGAARGRVAESVSAAVALAAAAIPEGLPFVATVAEVSASRRLAKHNLLVRNPRAMEALGRIDVICFDKTGTLTEGRIQLRAVSNGRSHASIERVGAEHRHIIAAALRASPVPDKGQVLPHPTDWAVVTGAGNTGVGATVGATRWRMLRELPFEPGRGFHAVLGAVASGHVISVKGAPEVVLPRCDTWRRDGHARALSDPDRREIEAEVDRLAQQGLRVLAVAERVASRRRQLDEERVDRLELLGLLGLADTTRATAAAAVHRLRSAGVKVVMLTGDHPSTAEAIGAELDLLNGGTVVTGADLADADESMVDALVAKAAVFARVSPAHKVEVVRSLRRAGHVVAVTGDGANDAPAIRLADVGLAMGDRGTTAARQAADMVVVDGRIETIADGVIEGRAMWASVRDAVALLLGGNLGETLFTVGSAAISPQPPLNTRQILFVNLMTDLLPALAVAARAPRGVTPDALAREGPESSLGTALTLEVARRAVATSLATTGGWLAARATGTAGRASSVAVASLVASQLAQTVVASRGDPAVLAAVAVSAAALVGTLQTPIVSQFFGSRPVGPVGWSIVGASAASAVAIGSIPARHLARLARPISAVIDAIKR